jgi:single-strand DNA-binding protein
LPWHEYFHNPRPRDVVTGSLGCGIKLGPRNGQLKPPEENMPGLNRVQLIGYLGRDPESRTTPKGSHLSTFSLGVTRRWKTGGASKEATDWFNVEMWGRLAEIGQQYLKKGSLVYLEGRLQTDKYEDKGGETKYFTKVVANTLQLLDRKPADEPVTDMSIDEDAAGYDT